MYQCKDIIELASRKMDTSLPWYVRIKMQAHLLICLNCRRYARQLQFMHKVLGAFENSSLTKHYQLSDDARQRIARKIQQAKDVNR